MTNRGKQRTKKIGRVRIGGGKGKESGVKNKRQDKM
jgi:hypothetical protein